jgi:predicted metal-dependent hydrolase
MGGVMPAGIVPEIRHRTFAFAGEPLSRIRGVPEVQLIAVTSLLSSPAERLVMAALDEAAPRLHSPDLRAAVEALLEQESSHIAAHAPLNAMLLGEIYPGARRLRRLGEEMLASYRDLPLDERLAVAAAYEYASDAIFGAVYEEHYRCGRRFHHDPAVHEALLASGVGPLFSWHALEELSHRHVAFEVALALGVTGAALRRGMARVLVDLARLQVPALVELVRGEPDGSLLAFSRAVFVSPGFVRTFAGRLLRWMTPGFDPGAERYAFYDALAGDVDRARPAAA